MFHTDAHMRFAKFWDVAIIDQWRLCGSDRAILTEYPRALKPGWLDRPVDDPCFTRDVDMRGAILNAYYFWNGRPELRFRVGRYFTGDRPRMGAFTAAGYRFGPGMMDGMVPYDPFMDFSSDECAMAARNWTSGFDFYYPCVRFVYHLYGCGGARGRGRPVPPAPSAGGMSRRERQGRRLEKLLGMHDRKDVDLSGFGLGPERSLSDYQAFCGVDFRRLSIREFAARGFFDEAHDGDSAGFFDWEKAYEDDYGSPVARGGKKLDIQVRGEVVDAFKEFCAGNGWHPQAALTEAIRAWMDANGGGICGGF